MRIVNLEGLLDGVELAQLVVGQAKRRDLLVPAVLGAETRRERRGQAQLRQRRNQVVHAQFRGRTDGELVQRATNGANQLGGAAPQRVGTLPRVRPRISRRRVDDLQLPQSREVRAVAALWVAA